MKKLTIKNNTRIAGIFTIIAIILVLFCIIRATALLDEAGKNIVSSTGEVNKTSLDDMNEGWNLIYPDGRSEEVSLPFTLQVEPMKELTLVKNIENLNEDNQTIIFDNLRQSVEVWVDGSFVHQVNKTKLVNQIRYTDYQLIPLPEGAKWIELTFSLSEDGIYNLPQIRVGDYYIALYEIISGDIITIFILLMLLILAVALLITFVVRAVRTNVDFRLISIAAFMMLSVAWGWADSYLPVITNVPQEVVGLICYCALMLFPLPMTAFIWLTAKRKSRIAPLLMILTAVNTITQLLLSICGVVELQKMIYISHGVIVLVIAGSFIGILNVKKQDKGNLELNIIFSAIVCLILTVVISMAIYWFGNPVVYRNVFLFGMLIFLIFLFISVVMQYAKQKQDEQARLAEIKIYEELSMYDKLTQLKNRRAFEEKLDEIDANPELSRKAVLIMLDVNGLKITNDNYGHAAGDELIVLAARAIKRVYEEDGECFRIGGDEFAVIMMEPKKSMRIYDSYLQAVIEAENESSRCKLSIARGSSYLENTAGVRLSISDWKQEADIMMYRNKAAMKIGTGRSLSGNLKSIIDCIISTIEAKDMYTAYHSDRVRSIAVLIGEKMGLSGPTLNNLEAAAYLHDIGKIGVPDNVLGKKGRLTDEEYDIMTKHCRIGSDIIGKAPEMYELSQIILHHHERFDGKGYPDKIHGTEIPIEARIIAVADSIDAMTSRRVYRRNLSMDECKKEIEKNAGLMYDPAIVSIALDNWSGIENILLLHPKIFIDMENGQ